MRPRVTQLGSAARRLRRVALALLVVAALVVGCSYADSEPGLFGSRSPTPGTDFPAPDQGPPAGTDPDLPVVGDTVWTSSEGLGLTSRIAVHAVRRIAGATVLDYSVTPLSAPGLAWGEKVPATVDFGLGRTAGGDVNALLLDPAARRALRPLQHRSRGEFQHCLCTPLWVAQLDLRIGATRLLQLAFPALPAGTRQVDVSLATLPVFTGVPVTPLGQVPTATVPTDLQRPPEDPAPLAPPFPVRPGPDGPQRLQTIRIDAIEAGPRTTSLRWTVRSLSDVGKGDAFPAGPPMTMARPGPAPFNPSTASGPQLRVGDRTLSALQVSFTTNGRERTECVCTAFGIWASDLRQAGGRASVTTVFPALPAGTRTVDVVLPTVTTIWRLPVTAVADGAARSGPPRPGPRQRWRYQIDQPPPGWPTDRWPTPLPDPAQLADYESLVGRVLPSSSR